LQERVVVALSELFGTRTAAGRFACQAFVASIASLVTLPIAVGDLDAVTALERPLIAHLRALVEGGLLA
jgi:hypothetical protein